jgi:hypothetical protein
MRKLYKWNTSVGPFYIAELDGRFLVIFDDESLGSYATAAQAVDDLAGGHTFSAGPGIDTAAIGISDNLAEWQRIAGT